MGDVIALMNSLVDVNGKILVPGVCDSVKAVTDEELASYDPIDFDMVGFMMMRRKRRRMMRRMRRRRRRKRKRRKGD